ncbi:MAG: hypothetical protein AAB665_04160 [Patescibacteria group bacterium]
MSINAEVSKTGTENALATIRKFSRRVQGAGLIKTVRKGRYFARDASKIVKKKRALKLIKRRAEFKQLVKEGKVAEPAPRRGSYGDRQGATSRPAESNPVPR